MALKRPRSLHDILTNLFAERAVNVISLIASVTGGAASVFLAFNDANTKKVLLILLDMIDRVIDNIFPSAHAGDMSPLNTHVNGSNTYIPEIMIVGVFIILLGCLYIVAIKPTTEATNERAWDMIKIIAGFFIGNLAHGLQ